MKKSEAMQLLKESRKKIDNIDEKILNLISERTSLARKIIKAKMALNMDIWDPEREKQIEQKTRKIARENKIDENKLIKIMRILTELNKMEQEQILRRK
ncbi:MAG TPA: chorismate mutase [Methanobacteriales archaeon]|nr:MAG: Chorismate mutase, type II [Methanobacteriaceae archaeon 41_258]MBC7089393.1 chorismate mutase [Methanobacteriaceae archaeon]MBC7097073.1 chorismate mutase [Methanobacteriales archaeon]HIH61444.1 chorismate mutase [Methanobacteriales archaeon]